MGKNQIQAGLILLKGKSREVAESTLVFYTKGVEKLIEFLGTAAEADISTVTRTSIVEFRNWLAERGSANTVHPDVGTIKSAFRSASVMVISSRIRLSSWSVY